MIRRRHRTLDSDEGSIILALLGVLILTSVVTVGLAAVVTGQHQVRHDQAFAQALAGAESGLDAMVAQVRQSPTASSFNPQSGADTTTDVTYQASATKTSTGWLVASTGTATDQNGHTITRQVQETVTVKGLYDVPLFGDTSLTMGSGSGVDQYDSSGSPTSCIALPNTGVGGLAATTMCTSAASGNGAAATNGSLTMVGSDLGDFSQVNVDNVPLPGAVDPEATGNCVGDAAACASSQVVTSYSKLSYPDSSVCDSGVGIDASAISGSNYLAAGTVYDVTGDLTLNAAVVANLANLSSSGITLCFNGNLTVPSLGVAGVTVPWNSTVNSVLPLTYTPRAPSTLMLIDTATSADGSTIDLGNGSNGETALSAVIYAPHATCTLSGHVDLYGAMVCGSVSASGGISVHYDTQLKTLTTQQTISVSDWREVH